MVGKIILPASFKNLYQNGLIVPFFEPTKGKMTGFVVPVNATPTPGQQYFLDNLKLANDIEYFTILTGTDITKGVIDNASYTTITADQYAALQLVLRDVNDAEVLVINLGELSHLPARNRRLYVGNLHIDWRKSYIEMVDNSVASIASGECFQLLIAYK